jgi:transcription termination factor Rho
VSEGTSPPADSRPIPPKIPIPPLPEDDLEDFEPIAEDEPVRRGRGAFDEEGFVPLAERERGDGGDPDAEETAEFVPIAEAPGTEPAREAPAGASAMQVLDLVRRGELHVAALAPIPDAEIAAVASRLGYSVVPGERRADLLSRLLNHPPDALRVETYAVEGLLELLPDGYGFLRRPETGYVADPSDPYVPGGLARRFGLQVGHWVSGTARRARPGERYPALLEIDEVNHEDPADVRDVVPFERLTVTHPDHRFLLETTQDELAMRLMDLFCPLGRGQRALIVSPPRAGKTILLQKLADSLARNSPEVEIVVLLVDERPEEVTNMRRSVRGEVIASTFDYPAHRHIRVAELVMEKVKRMVELGRHVVLLLDSLTRLGRAYNNEAGGGGRLLTGGLDSNALTKPKRFFGAARNIEHGGSLTIIATALVDTGSRLDQVIFEEFKGTGNMEIALSRDIANQRIWPAIDLARSGTRKEELLLHPEEQRRVVALRREMQGEDPAEALSDLLERMGKYATNAEFLMHVQP